MANVLVVTSSYPSPTSPVAGVFVREHALAALGRHRLAVLHLDRRPGLRRLLVERDVDEVGAVLRVAFPEQPTALSYLGLAAAARRGFAAIRADGFAPDLVHAHLLPAIVPSVFLQRTPVVASEHWSVFLPDDPATLPAPLKRIAREAFDRARFVLPVSEALARELRMLGVRAPIEVVPNAVDTGLFHPGGVPAGNEPPRLLTVALLYEAKGVDLLLRALPLLRTRAAVDIVGDGPMRPELERLAAGHDVTFHGMLAKPDVAALMRRADLYVLPSRFDNNPVALLEAQASGLPVVATRVGGVPELVPPDALVDATPESIAAGIDTALSAPAERGSIATAAAARWGRSAVASRLDRVYAAALGR
jgi:glycosyltransferase involved in cell wall biosynthesis